MICPLVYKCKECVKSSPSPPHEFSFLGRRGGDFLPFFLLSSLFRRREPTAISVKERIPGYFLAFFSLRPPGADGDSGERENSRLFSCFPLLFAPQQAAALLAKGELPPTKAQKISSAGRLAPRQRRFFTKYWQIFLLHPYSGPRKAPLPREKSSLL